VEWEIEGGREKNREDDNDDGEDEDVLCRWLVACLAVA